MQNISATLRSLMQERRQMIARVPGFRSGATDRSSPLLREVQGLDLRIINVAAAEGLTEVQAWGAF